MASLEELGMLGVAIWALVAAGVGAFVVTRRRAGPEEYADPKWMVSGTVMGIACGLSLGLLVHSLLLGLPAGAAAGMSAGGMLQYMYGSRALRNHRQDSPRAKHHASH